MHWKKRFYSLTQKKMWKYLLIYTQPKNILNRHNACLIYFETLPEIFLGWQRLQITRQHNITKFKLAEDPSNLLIFFINRHLSITGVLFSFRSLEDYFCCQVQYQNDLYLMKNSYTHIKLINKSFSRKTHW